jgi:hypothetical protein
LSPKALPISAWRVESISLKIAPRRGEEGVDAVPEVEVAFPLLSTSRESRTGRYHADSGRTLCTLHELGAVHRGACLAHLHARDLSRCRFLTAPRPIAPEVRRALFAPLYESCDLSGLARR